MPLLRTYITMELLSPTRDKYLRSTRLARATNVLEVVLTN